ncbi:Non-ribosomal peptide synthetase [Saccharothrix espanaensis DSM 44229]|uniref:Non-ribosomal peptide synthetase n=1 Tax=Saccharothrix espanaensis (strain ATCC 51144 / DSM 44229 / JCM 9112 / NBRC 15066 / NRRL 15764) TaxID=1179773 RepID=K0JSX5_SACES|nr:non-ribosomal peptide synthetase [Saccharothrix espanaensis]CCH30860.1 Non-ribosomal peptide synthetase [Saccharothrix espanaensis DSM 44229]
MYTDPAVRTTPALPLQRGMIAAGLRDPEAGTDVIQCVQRFTGPFEAGAYLDAWRAAVERHPILRTRFRWRPDGDAEQWAGPAADVPMVVDDAVTDGSAFDLAGFLAEDRRAGVDPVGGPPLRLRVLPGNVVVATFHHAILDGRSLAILLSEIDDAYASGGTAPFAARPEFADYAHWYAERTAPEHPAAAADRRFWADELAGLPEPGLLPLEHNGSATPVMGKAGLDLSDTETAAVRALADAAGVTVNTVVLAAWGLLLTTHSGTGEAVFGVTRAARHGSVPGAQEMVGLLLATVPLRLPVDRDLPVTDWLRDVRARSVAARDHQLSPLPDIQRAAGHDALMRSLVLFEHREINTVLSARPTAPTGRHVEILRSPSYAMTLYAFAEPHLSLHLIHDTTRFPDWAPDALLAQFRDLLAGLAEAPTRPVRELTEPRGAELVRVVEKWNDTAVEYPADSTVPDLFADQVRLRPDADAVHDGTRWLSYAELDARSTRLAHALVARGARPDQPVGLALPRGADLVTAMLAVVKTGAAYLPLDPGNPAVRDAAALAESGTALVVTDGNRPLPAGITAVQLSEVDTSGVGGPDTPLPPAAHPLGVAYLNYTSGSTGRPKGVAVPHRGVVRLVTNPTFGRFGPGQTFLHQSATAFDLTTLEVWGPLLTGGRVVAAPDGPPDPAVLADLLREHRVTVLWLTAGFFHQLVAHAPEVLASVDQLLAGGDVLAPDAVRAALVARNGKPVVNGYGPTENTTFTSCHVITDPRQVGGTVPIGTPVQRSTVYVLDDRLRPVPVGVPGELYTGGAGLARGYWANPALTAAKFVPDPFGGEPGARLYRTGDLARWRPDGVLEFLGRADQQVKVRGFLVEPAEVEAVLREHDGVAQTAVLPFGDGDARHLVAYLVGDADVADLRRHTEERLPAYLCPARYVVVAALPLNRNGKVDRAALREVKADGAPAAERTRPAEGTPLRLARLWQVLLGCDDVRAEDDFFAVGGNSLLAVRLAFRVREEFGVDVPVADLHRARTLAACAQVIDRARSATPGQGITRRDRTAYLVPAQRTPEQTGAPVTTADRDAATADERTVQDHLVLPRGTGNWAAWRWVELRGTGFGIEPLLAIASPDAARAAEAVLAADDRLGQARWAAFRVLRAVEDQAEGEQRSALRKIGRLVRKGRFAEARDALAHTAEVTDALAEAALAAGDHEAALADYAARFEQGRREAAGVLHVVSGDPKFREAVAWQNPRALQTAVDALHKALSGLRDAGRNVDYRRWEHTVVSYLQRYCAKNDTIGFFGPVGWARVRDDATAALVSRPGPGLVDKRTTYLENWAVQQLAETLTTDDVRPWAVPRRMPFVSVVGDVLHVPLTEPVRLPPLEAAVLTACDGRRRAHDIAGHVGADRAEVLAVLERLRQARRIAWTLEVPPSALVPELALRSQVEGIDDPEVRRRVAGAVDEVVAGRDQVAAAVGDPDRLVHAIADLQERFTAITGAAAVRRPGLFYAGRTLVHEECRRDLEVDLSPALLDTLWPSLELVLEAARWFTCAGSALYTRALKEVFREHAGGRTSVRLADFWMWANDTIFRLDDRMVGRLVTALQERWATALGPHDPAARHVRRSVADVREAVLRLFAAPRPGWRGAVQHSPDVLIAAKDADAVRAGDYQWVLGEVHPGVNTMRSALFVSQHPDPVQLHEAMRRDMAGPRVVLTTTREQGGTPQRLADALVLPEDLRIAFGHDSCGPDIGGAVPIGDFEVVDDNGKLRARSRDGRVDLELVELLSEQIMAQLVQKFRLLPSGDHTPRVSLDRLVVARESWQLPASRSRFAFAADEPGRFLGAQAWRREHGMPRFVFVKSPVEHKPFYVDLESGPSVELFAHAVRALEREQPDSPMGVGEMLPGPDQLWLTDAAGNRHTAEFRLVAVDRRGWRKGGTR